MNWIWTDSTVSPNFATNYAIQESTDGVNFTTVANAGQESTSYTVTGLSQSTTYYFEVVGSNSAGSSGPSNIANATTTNQTGQTPTAPQGLGATPASGSEVYLDLDQHRRPTRPASPSHARRTAFSPRMSSPRRSPPRPIITRMGPPA